MKKKTNAELEREIESLKEKIDDRKNTQEKQKKLISILAPEQMPILRKLEICLELHGNIELKKLGDGEYDFCHDIRGGWCSFRAASVEEGLNKLLFLS